MTVRSRVSLNIFGQIRPTAGGERRRRPPEAPACRRSRLRLPWKLEEQVEAECGTHVFESDFTSFFVLFLASGAFASAPPPSGTDAVFPPSERSLDRSRFLFRKSESSRKTSSRNICPWFESATEMSIWALKVFYSHFNRFKLCLFFILSAQNCQRFTFRLKSKQMFSFLDDFL